MDLDIIDRKLIDGWQRNFPLVPSPFTVIAEAVGVTEQDALERLQKLQEQGIISRIGAVVTPNTIGTSTLAAIAVPPEQVCSMAAIINAEPGVNHNYEREHTYNLWFVVTGRDRTSVASSLARIEAETGHRVLDLPLLISFHIDLGFPIFDANMGYRRHLPYPEKRIGGAARPFDLSLLSALENGLPLEARPFREIARKLDLTEAELLEDLTRLVFDGIISRFGVIVRHSKLGFQANAMVVWDVPDDAVEGVARRFCSHTFVTLCYQRPRRLPQWRYNLFCMIHGRDRETVRRQALALQEEAGPLVDDHDILFSTRCFRQRGARLTV